MKPNMKPNKGGRVLASGGFGCVFTPALKCEGATQREQNKVSKLMTSEHAISEYKEITSFKNKLDTIKDYEDYFLLSNATLCKPAKLTTSDLRSFTKKCTALPKKDITQKNINDHLDKLMMLNIPNGGIPVDDFLYTGPGKTFEKISRIHTSLVNLLEKGIVPMNKKHVYHCDIKDSNVLVQEMDGTLKTRLIDWGLSTEYTPFKNQPFPTNWRNRPLQFNVPFSVIIFSEYFVDQYTMFLKNGGIVDETNLKPFVMEFVVSWMKQRGGGHYKFINEIMFMLFSHSIKDVSARNMPKVIETHITMPYIVDYIVDVLVHFTAFRDDGKLDLRVYLDNIYIKIVDIYGFINVYYPILEVLYKHYPSLSQTELELFNQLKFIFVEYLYRPRHEEIHMRELIDDLKILGGLITISLTETNSTTPITSSLGTASGIKTRKRRNLRKNSAISFKRRPKYRRFKNPIFLSAK